MKRKVIPRKVPALKMEEALSESPVQTTERDVKKDATYLLEKISQRRKLGISRTAA